MSRADVVVFTVGNSAGYWGRQERARPANVRVAAAVPAMALLAAAADGPQSRGSLDPVPRSSKLTRVNCVLHRLGHERRQDRQDQDAALPGAARIEDDDALALRHGVFHHRQRHGAPRG